MSTAETKLFFIKLTKFLDLFSLIGIIFAIVVIQKQISEINPQREGGVVRLQNWLTALMCISSYLCVNEIYDSFLRQTLLPQEQQEPSQLQNQEQEEEIECSAAQCSYHLFFCGIFRNCIIRDELPHEQNRERKATRCGVVLFTILSLVFATVTLSCQFVFFSQLFSRYQPHYSIDTSISNSIKAQISQLYIAKGVLIIYLVVPAIQLRISKYVIGGLVLLILWPVILAHYFFINRKLEHEDQEEKQEQEQRHLQVLQESPALSGRNSVRLNQVASARDVNLSEADEEMAPRIRIRNSLAPLNNQNQMGNSSNRFSNFREAYLHQRESHLDLEDASTGIGRDNSRRHGLGAELSFDRIEQASSMDIIEEIRRESKKIKLRPREMIKEIEKLAVKFKKTEDDCSECAVCLVSFEENADVVPLPCSKSHVFHKSCVLSWAQQSYTCPICRKPVISSEKEIEMYEMMQHRNQMNEHEDNLMSAVVNN